MDTVVDTFDIIWANIILAVSSNKTRHVSTFTGAFRQMNSGVYVKTQHV